MKTDIRKFKQYLSETMIQVFEHTGNVDSLLFILYKDDKLLITTIPTIIMTNLDAKNFIAILIREKCKDPNMKSVALISEVDISDENHEKTADGLMLSISIPEGDDVTIWKVDCENHKVLGKDSEEFTTEDRGRFSRFFQK